MQRQVSCVRCSSSARARKRDFSDQAYSMLLAWGEIDESVIDAPICDECYKELRELLIERAEDSLEQEEVVPVQIKKIVGTTPIMVSERMSYAGTGNGTSASVGGMDRSWGQAVSSEGSLRFRSSDQVVSFSKVSGSKKAVEPKSKKVSSSSSSSSSSKSSKSKSSLASKKKSASTLKKSSSTVKKSSVKKSAVSSKKTSLKPASKKVSSSKSGSVKKVKKSGVKKSSSTAKTSKKTVAAKSKSKAVAKSKKNSKSVKATGKTKKTGKKRVA